MARSLKIQRARTPAASLALGRRRAAAAAATPPPRSCLPCWTAVLPPSALTPATLPSWATVISPAVLPRHRAKVLPLAAAAPAPLTCRAPATADLIFSSRPFITTSLPSLLPYPFHLYFLHLSASIHVMSFAARRLGHYVQPSLAVWKVYTWPRYNVKRVHTSRITSRVCKSRSSRSAAPQQLIIPISECLSASSRCISLASPSLWPSASRSRRRRRPSPGRPCAWDSRSGSTPPTEPDRGPI